MSLTVKRVQVCTYNISELSDRQSVGSMLAMQTSVGFLLTIASIYLFVLIQELVGWRFSFTYLVIGPVLGIVAMQQLRSEPEASLIAGGLR